MSDLTGQQFGGFKVSGRAAARDRVRYWSLACLGCGLIREEMQVSLKQGFVPECDGCGDSADPFAWDERAEIGMTEAVEPAPVADPSWPWPWAKKDDYLASVLEPEAPKTLTPDEAAEDLYSRIDARIEAERAAIEASVIVDVAADTNGPTAEIESDVSLVEEPEDLFSQFETISEPTHADGELAREVTFVEVPEGSSYAPPAAPDPDVLLALMHELAARQEALSRPIVPASNPIADAVDSIAAALTELAKALRG